MRRKKGMILFVMAVFIGLAGLSSGRADAADCYNLYWGFNCNWTYPDPDYDYKGWYNDYLVLYENGSWELAAAESPVEWRGFWGSWGALIWLQSMSEVTGYPAVAFTGTKKQGFFVFSDTMAEHNLPGCYYLKKTKLEECWWVEEK